VSTFLAGSGVLYLLLPPQFSVQAVGTGHIAGFVLFLIVGTTISYLAGTWRDNMARLQESERTYRTIGEAINYGVWVCDADGRNTYSSESFLRLVGLSQQECSEFGWARVLHPEDRERTLAAWKECVQNKSIWDVEHRFLGVDGKYHHVLARGAPVTDDAGRILCWAGINLDITSLREAEQEKARLYESLRQSSDELRKTNQELEQFAFAASHDLQEPLRNIRIYTQILMRDLGPLLTPVMQRNAEFVTEGANRLHNLISDLLSYSRTVYEDEDSHASSGSLQAALTRALAALRPDLDAAGAEVEADPLPAVACSETRLSDVLYQLLSNAVKYRTPDRPLRIQIQAAVTGETCTVSVRDNGIGFRPEYAEYIFGLFRRLQREPFAGNGLGLAVCKRIIESRGGRIWAESNPGEWAVFHFSLPVATDEQRATAQQSN
jgi:PAS domain S-box-containing protein